MKGQRVSVVSFVPSIGNVISNIFRLLVAKSFGVRLLILKKDLVGEMDSIFHFRLLILKKDLVEEIDFFVF